MCDPVCQNGGTCSPFNQCTCDSGWTGAGCETGDVYTRVTFSIIVNFQKRNLTFSNIFVVRLYRIFSLNCLWLLIKLGPILRESAGDVIMMLNGSYRWYRWLKLCCKRHRRCSFAPRVCSFEAPIYKRSYVAHHWEIHSIGRQNCMGKLRFFLKY